MKITKVAIEGMHNVVRKEYTFNNLTYLHGPNGAGKSTVMQAVQLALLGYIPGTSKASKSAIFEHANGHALAITLSIDDNGSPITVSRVWSGTSSNVTNSVEVQPLAYTKKLPEIVEALELPIFNFNDFLDLTANKMKDWFINFLPSAEMEIDWVKVLTDDAEGVGVSKKDCWNTVNQEVEIIRSMKLEGSDLIRAVNTHFKDVLSYKKKELERATSTIQSLIYHDDVDMNMSIDEVISQIHKYEATMNSAKEYSSIKRRNDSIVASLKEYESYTAESFDKDPKYISLRAKYDEASNSIQKYRDDIADLQATVAESRTTMSELVKREGEITATINTKKEIATSDGICPFTKAKCDSVQPLIKQYADDIEELKKELEDVRKSYFDAKSQIEETEGEIKNLNDKIHQANTVMNECVTTSNSIENRYATKTKLQREIIPVPEYDETDYTSNIAELRNIQIKYEANKKYSELIDTLTADKFKIDQEILMYKSWINLTGVNGLQNDDNAIKPFLDLQNQMNKYLQAVFGDDITSKFNLEAKANSFSFGISRDNRYIPYNLLSSGEKCMYTLALMMSLTEVCESPLKIVMVDDLLDHLDDVNINKLFESLSKVEDIQMIFAGVKPVSVNNITVEVTK